MTTSITPGTCLGPYEIKDVLGSGGLGVVYRAYQASLERDVALKVLASALTVDADLVERFRREAKIAASLQHPHIVTIYDTGAAEGSHYIAMELLTGRTLNHLPLPLEPLQAAEIVRQLAEALAYAHGRGVIHRDLKPENALINDAGHVTLTDFGIARVVGQASLTLGGGPMGTPEFMAPEQARGEPADARSDVYSLGIMLYYLVAGKSPFLAENALATMYRQMHEALPSLPVGTPDPLRKWVQRCSAKNPASRYDSGKEALEALREAIATCPASVPVDRDPLDAVLRGDLSLAEALAIHREREAEIRSAFQKEITAMSLDVVRSSLLKAPGHTIMASFTFGALRRFIQEAVDGHGCMASNWSGDGLMALFPSADEAAAAAQEILEGLPGFNASGSGLQDAVQVRIGLHHGPVLMSDTQRLGEIASPTLDMAGRLQKESPSDTVLVSRATWSRLANQETWHPSDPVVGIPTYVLSAAHSISPAYPTPSFPTPFPPAASSSSPVLRHNSLDTMVRPGLSPVPYGGSPPAPSSSTSLPPVSRPPAVGSLAVGWAGILTAGVFTTLNLGFPHVFSLLFWVLSLVWVGRIHRSGFRFWPAALAITLLCGGIGLTGLLRDLYMIEFFGWAAGWALAGTAAVGEMKEKKRAALRGRVVLERSGAGGWELPAAARSRLADVMAPAARQMGFRPRQLGLRITPVLAGPRLSLHLEAYDRDTGAALGQAVIEGDVEDAVGLAEDVAFRLCRQLSPRALPGPQ